VGKQFPEIMIQNSGMCPNCALALAGGKKKFSL
jgi:hypothetical protein